MCSLLSASKRLGLLACLSAFPLLTYGQARFDLQGGEFPITGPLQGDQVFTQIALNTYGGYIVWQDNATDGDGYGISARKIDRTLSGALGGFRVNEAGAGDQTAPRISLLANGGVVFVWQSASGSASKVYARFLRADGTFATGDVAVSSFTGEQSAPTVASLNDGTVVVVWSSIGQEKYGDGRSVPNGMQGVFAQRFTVAGEKIGTEIQVNSTLPLNQRTPDIAPLANGNFVVVWVSEVLVGTKLGATDPTAGVTIYDVILNGQVFSADGARVGRELALTSNVRVCANPAVVSNADGFTVTWSGRLAQPLSQAELDESWDVFGRVFDLNGVARKAEFRVNSYTYGDQFRPQIASQDGINFVLWTSLKQDGSWEGVVARLLSEGGEFMSTEFRVNTTVAGKQLYPALASNGGHTFLTVWSSFVGGVSSFDLLAQRYSSSAAPPLSAPGAPYVSALSQTRLSVTWPELAGFAGVRYEIYVDQNTIPVIVQNNSTTVVSLQPDSNHQFRLAYLLADGTRSPLSEAGSGKTWAEDSNFDGLPDNWQSQFWGASLASWPVASADSDGDGATNVQELLAGTNPADAASVLRARMLVTSQGPRLEWNTEPGSLYQVQSQGTDQVWVSLGTPRFAAGKTDSIPVDAGQDVALYRVIRVR